MPSEDSVMTSLDVLIATEEENRRKEQIARAQMRKLADERRILEEQQREAEIARKLSEEESRIAAVNAAAARRQELERITAIERVRADLELQAKITLLKMEQENELARLSLVRDQRVVTLTRLGAALSALCVALVVGFPVAYYVGLRPNAQRLTQALTQERARLLEERVQSGSERSKLEAKIVGLERQVQALRAQSQLGNITSPSAPTKHAAPVAGPRSRGVSGGSKVDCVNDYDPLCGNLDSK